MGGRGGGRERELVCACLRVYVCACARVCMCVSGDLCGEPEPSRAARWSTHEGILVTSGNVEP